MIYFWLTGDQFAKIARYPQSDMRSKERLDHRRVISSIVHVLKSGGRWADALWEVYGVPYCLARRSAKVR